MRKLFPLYSLLALASIMLAACGTPVAATPVTVEVTRIVTVEVPAVSGEAPTAAAPAPAQAPVAGGERLQAVLDRGKVICGVHGTFQGFGFVFCRSSLAEFYQKFIRNIFLAGSNSTPF